MTRDHELAFAILCSQNGWHKARIHEARDDIRNLIMDQEKQIEALQTEVDRLRECWKNDRAAKRACSG